MQTGAQQGHGRRGRHPFGVGLVQPGQCQRVAAPEQPAQPLGHIDGGHHFHHQGVTLRFDGHDFLFLEGIAQGEHDLIVARRQGGVGRGGVVRQITGIRHLNGVVSQITGIQHLTGGVVLIHHIRHPLGWSEIVDQVARLEQGLEHAPQQAQTVGVEPTRDQVPRQTQQAQGITGATALLGAQQAQVTAPAVTDFGHGQASWVQVGKK